MKAIRFSRENYSQIIGAANLWVSIEDIAGRKKEAHDFRNPYYFIPDYDNTGNWILVEESFLQEHFLYDPVRIQHQFVTLRRIG